MDPKARVAQRLLQLREEFAQGLHERLDQIGDLWCAIRDGTAPPENIEELKRSVHSMAGNAGTFGYPGLGTLARMLNDLFDTIAPQRELLEPETRAQVERLLCELQNEAAAAQPTGDETSAILGVASPPPSRGRTIYIVEDDAALAEDLSLHLGYYGYKTRVFPTIVEAREQIIACPPALVILDLVFDEGPDVGLKLAREICHGVTEHIAVLILSVRGDFEARLQAVRANVSSYLIKPVDMATLIERVDELCCVGENEPYRVLIVDDSRPLASFYAAVLEHAGLHTRVVNDPLQAIDIMGEFEPELVLMDVYMPGCNGAELAAVIRQQEAYHSTPIVFLSSEIDPDRQLAAMRGGGDDFLTKPISAVHLVSSCISRLMRAREMRRLITRDSLTRLLNHSSGTDRLDAELARAHREGLPVAVAMLDIDLFKRVNDRYGHPTGDRVIKTVARLLLERLRKSDSPCRYGGEEFLVILPATGKEAAANLVDRIRRDFSGIRHQHRGAYFFASLSAGVSDSTSAGNPSALIDRADAALYRAKLAGRNRVELG
ncbi:MAG: diguanylate cyclase [Acidimicrobiia bacterium]|nr:diguanylate cyclase [Acidimicrobiia bacterium]MDX2465800.1 diguanylate cyclase [Acidimicrobiia bacterium]